MIEKFNCYKAVSIATEKLYVVYSVSDISGNKKTPSVIVKDILKMFGSEILLKANNLPVEFFCTSPSVKT